MPSPAGWREVPCRECGRFVEGIDFGERCADCHGRRRRRADRLAARVAIVATGLIALWVLWQPRDSPAARWYAGVVVIVNFFLVRFIARRIAMEVLP